MAYGLVEYLKERNIKYKENYDLKDRSTIKIGAKVDYYITPSDREELISLVRVIRELGLPYKVIGRLSNTLFCGDYKGAVISTDLLCSMHHSDGIFSFDAGASLASSLAFAAKLGFGGAEQLRLIPGSLAGAVVGNAGAHGLEISNIFESADVYFPVSDKRITLSLSDMRFSYRNSLLKSSDAVVLGVSLRLRERSRDAIKDDLRSFILARRKTQPNLPSLGCIFKRSGDISAGYYIDKSGLKGTVVGGAAVSDIHAGFIVNTGGAVASDVLMLMSICKNKVRERFGVLLEEEINII